MMLVVGYVKRKYKKLRELMQSRIASGIAGGAKKVISEISEQRGETCELFLLDPNQPKMRPEYGPRNDVVLCDWFELSRKGNVTSFCLMTIIRSSIIIRSNNYPQ